MPEPFSVRGCALLAIATGKRAQTLRELRDNIATAHPACIYYHFWGDMLRPSFDEPEFANDFASWARHGLHDHRLAERLGVIDPLDSADMESLRQEVIDVVEERLDEGELVPWSRADQQFHFLRSQIVIFDLNTHVREPGEFTDIIPEMSAGSIFYHFIDARRRTKYNLDDFRAWLWGFGDQYKTLIDEIGALDPYFSNLAELRGSLTRVFRDHFSGVRSRT
ncbi:MAG: hypothetical protein KAW17_08270 [Candidatus Eisenbacteria sp.]|nr:hypothetical protein [Candidatus Eisenbacteria bacterium]